MRLNECTPFIVVEKNMRNISINTSHCQVLNGAIVQSKLKITLLLVEFLTTDFLLCDGTKKSAIRKSTC